MGKSTPKHLEVTVKNPCKDVVNFSFKGLVNQALKQVWYLVTETYDVGIGDTVTITDENNMILFNAELYVLGFKPVEVS